MAEPFDVRDDDLLAALARLDPFPPGAPAEPGPAPDLAARAAAIGRRDRRRRRLRTAAIAGAATLVAAAAAWRLYDVAPAPEAVACATAADLDAARFTADRTLASPEQGCLSAWPDDVPLPGAVAACVSAEGAVLVVPTDAGDAVCDRLGLPRYRPGDDEVAIRLAQADLTEVDVATDCIPMDEATTLARRTLDDRGLGHWSVVVGRDGPCGSYAFEPQARRVVVVGIPPNPTPRSTP